MRVVGVDGYRRGWVAVVLENGVFAEASSAPAFAAIRSRYEDAAAIGVDIPIGLPEAPPRPADVAARSFLAPRGSGVFTTYPAWIYEAARDLPHRERYAEARRRCRERAWPVVSAQSFALGERILELAASAGDPQVIEVHPEVSFRELAGRDLGGKKSWNGQMARRRALERAGIAIPDEVQAAADVPADDLLDAAAAAWSAQRYADGTARPLPEGHPRGTAGAIWR